MESATSALRVKNDGLVRQLDELAKQMDVSRRALLGFFRILKEDEVPLEQLADKLALVAQRHNDQLSRLRSLDPEDDGARSLIEAAREVIRNAGSSADYDRAADLIFQAEETQDKLGLRRWSARHMTLPDGRV
ncbi:hypothetical protein RBB77_13965 [Tunturibacter psychrotolerans]|uniref:Uncharacterized protein n=1 Tax=Tunturiibacter psychrotolerans TaxID=3069686 RepID=A0AAU7ZL94_9BACT